MNIIQRCNSNIAMQRKIFVAKPSIKGQFEITINLQTYALDGSSAPLLSQQAQRGGPLGHRQVLEQLQMKRKTFDGWLLSGLHHDNALFYVARDDYALF